MNLSNLGFASSQVEYDMDIYIPEAALRGTAESSGRATITWMKDQAPEVCFYLAYKDPAYFWDPSRNINRTMNKNKSHRPNLGSMDIVKSNHDANWNNPIVRVPNTGLLQLDFRFILPQWPDRAKEQFLFHQFYPQKLSECPRNGIGIKMPNALFKAKVSYPKRWALNTPGYHNGHTITQEGRFLTFNLSIGHKIETILVDNLPVTIIYRSQFMNRAKYYLQSFLRQNQKMVGSFPFDRLVFIETEDLEKGAIPGVITLNRPRQSGMQMFQNDMLNWGLWQLAFYTSQQWFGAALYSENNDDLWFYRGTADFLASLVLRSDQKIYNIINSDEDRPWITFNHRQSADLIASILGILRPENALTNAQFESKIKYLEQHNFTYIRHLLALRFSYWYQGEDFLKLLRKFYKKHKGSPSSHRDFFELVKGEKTESSLSQYLKLWWQRSDWPEFSLKDISYIESHDEVSSVNIKVGQNPNFKLPYDLALTFSSGLVISKRLPAESSEVKINFSQYKSTYLNDSKGNHDDKLGRLVKAEINPGREIFDSNRFNNSNEWPEVLFFPGNADTIRDDAFTVVWLPFVSKLPGEPFSFMLSSQVFKYVNSGLSLLINHIPNHSITGFNAVYLSDLPKFSTFATISAVQDFGLSLRGQRIFDLSLTRSNIIDELPGFSLGLRLRHRGSVGVKEQNHETLSLYSTFQTRGMSSCGLDMYGIHEGMVGEDREFYYQRSHVLASGFCRTKYLEATARGFWGTTKEDGVPPAYVRFNPQTVDEGRLRIDSPNLSTVQRLWTSSLDLEVQAHLPIPSYLFLLPRHSKWRFFYDYGQSQGPSFSYSDYGLGFKLPLGGDVVGKRSLSLASLSVLAVLEKTYEGKTSKKPGILVDFLGKL